MNEVDLDDELTAIAAGDADAFGRWVAGAEYSIRSSLRSFAEVVDAEVVCQETLLRVWQVAPRVVRDGRGNSLLRLALRTARHLAIDEVRRHRRRMPSVDLDVNLEPAPRFDRPDPLVTEAIRKCRERLPRRPKEALGARLDRGGAGHDRDLAAGLGMKLNTFLKNIGRARKLLLECLKKSGIRAEDVLTDESGPGTA